MIFAHMLIRLAHARSRLHWDQIRGWSSMRVRAGFTLFELLAVMVMGGIIAATATPRLSSSLAQTRLQRAAATVSLDLKSAYSLAERQRAPVSIAVDTDAGIVRLSDARAPSPVFSERLLSGAGGFGITSMKTSSNSITVYPNGLASGDLTITLTAAHRSRVVKMTRTGLVRVSTL
jgi:prepilin-type N-terminal cleavage/methylation domain-containing protein